MMVEATAVEARGRTTAQCCGLWSDDHMEPMRRIVRFVKSQNSIPGIQLAHAGRKASTHNQYIKRQELTLEEGGCDDIVGPSAIG